MAHRVHRAVLAAILALAALLLTHPGAHAALTPSQQSATLSFLQRFPGKLDYLSTRWTGTDYCSWEGISCDANGLVSVNLSGKGLTGYMPEIEDNIDGSLIMVVSIDMSSNTKITGNFEDDWAALKNLKQLDLSSTALYGNIPDAWNGMTALEEVKIMHTAACRNLPNWNMTSLRTADLSNNNMGGTLASSWSGMSSLQSVTLTGNSFCGCVPTTWTSAVLQAAASAIGGNLVAASCATSNVCTDNSYVCPQRANPAASMPAPLAAVALLAAVLTVLAL